MRAIPVPGPSGRIGGIGAAIGHRHVVMIPVAAKEHDFGALEAAVLLLPLLDMAGGNFRADAVAAGVLRPVTSITAAGPIRRESSTLSRVMLPDGPACGRSGIGWRDHVARRIDMGAGARRRSGRQCSRVPKAMQRLNLGWLRRTSCRSSAETVRVSASATGRFSASGTVRSTPRSQRRQQPDPSDRRDRKTCGISPLPVPVQPTPAPGTPRRSNEFVVIPFCAGPFRAGARTFSNNAANRIIL